jgi:F-type H+-transporting ATPase subunit b
MDLITPEFGLIFWQTLIFLVVLLVLGKFAWRPIVEALKSREDAIEDALKSAAEAREEVEKLKTENEKLIAEAKAERDAIIQEARKMAAQVQEEAKTDAVKAGDRMIADARSTIKSEKEAALKAIKDQVAELSLEISSRLLRENLKEDASQEKLVQKYLKDLKIN